MLGLSAQPFGSPAPAERLVLYPLLARVSHFLSFLPSVARVACTRTAPRHRSAHLPAIVRAASTGGVGGHRIRAWPPLYAVLLAGATVTVSSSSSPTPSPSTAPTASQVTRIPRLRPLTWPPLSRNWSSCSLTSARLGFSSLSPASVTVVSAFLPGPRLHQRRLLLEW